MIVTTRIPTHYNDGLEISLQERRRVLSLIRDKFGGYTLEGPSHGVWVGDDGWIYDETSYRLEVIVSTEQQVLEARELFMRVGKQFGQLALYFEMREGGEIIDLDEDDSICPTQPSPNGLKHCLRSLKSWPSSLV